MSRLVRALSENGGAVICALDSTDIVREMEQIHHTSAPMSAALGRLLTAASLMGSMLKNPEDSLTLRVDGGGPGGVLVAVTDGDGNVRGYAGHPQAELPLRADGKLDVGGVVGATGNLTVMRDLGMKEPYIGRVPLATGEIAEDITAYYAKSEQTPTVCALGVVVNKDLTILRAGGYLLQLLPGASDAEIDLLESNIQKIPSVTSFLESGGDLYALIDTVLAGFSPNVLEEREVSYQCKCSREKTERILISLGAAELADMMAEAPDARVECHFCGKEYEIPLAPLLAELRRENEAPSLTTGGE